MPPTPVTGSRRLPPHAHRDNIQPRMGGVFGHKHVGDPLETLLGVGYALGISGTYGRVRDFHDGVEPEVARRVCNRVDGRSIHQKLHASATVKINLMVGCGCAGDYGSGCVVEIEFSAAGRRASNLHTVGTSAGHCLNVGGAPDGTVLWLTTSFPVDVEWAKVLEIVLGVDRFHVAVPVS